MPEFLCTGTVLTCSFGAAPSMFSALDLPGMPLLSGALPAADITQIAPMANIMPFGMCSSPENPEVAAATAAALGVLTPMPCVPVPAAPWDPPSQMDSGNGVPLATASSKCLCAWGGTIAVDVPVSSPDATTA